MKGRLAIDMNTRMVKDGTVRICLRYWNTHAWQNPTERHILPENLGSLAVSRV